MSPYTTLHFGRSEAIRKITYALQDCSNEELGNILDVVLEKSLHNALVCPDCFIDDIRREKGI